MAARLRQDPLIGSAPPEPRLLLVEVDGGWGPKGFADTHLPEDVKAEVLSVAAETGAKVMLIRRPGRHSSSVCLMRAWCLVDTRTGTTRWGTYAYPTELLEACDLLRGMSSAGGGADVAEGDGDVAAAWGGPGAGGPGEDGGREPELILVCTHGKKDVCCATRGRPVAAELARRWPEQTWECSHTGGDRFAANLLLLPEGAAYGELDTGQAVDLVEEHLAGRPSLTHLRGAVGRSRAEQGALLAVHTDLGPLPWGSVEVVASERWEAAGDEADPVTRVELALADGRRAAVEVTERPRPGVPLTCGGPDKVSVVPHAGPVTLR